MSRITTHATIDAAPEASRPLLEAVKKKIGQVPNLYRLVANSPAALQGLLGFSESLSKGSLGAKLGERLALTVAEINGCGYCLSAHSYIAANLLKLDAAEVAAARAGTSSDPKADAALRFAAAVAQNRGKVDAAAVQAVRDAGFTEGEIVEIVSHVALNVLTNYLNETLKTEIDFPAVQPKAA